METRSFRWTCDDRRALAGVGVDGERVARFRGDPAEIVFGEEERRHACRGDGRDALRLCLAFCVKEVLWKALGEPYDLRECRVRVDVEKGWAEVCPTGELARRLRGLTVEARIWPGETEAVAAVLLLQGGGAP